MGLIIIFQYLKGSYKEDGSSLHKKPHGEARSNGYKLHQKRFCLDIRKKLFTVRTINHWKNLLMDVVETPSLEIFRI